MRKITPLIVAAILILPALAACETEKPYSEPEALSLLVTERSEPYILVDVRTPEEYDSGHIPTAVNIPVSDIAENLPAEDRSALLIVYCGSGRRSATAKKTLDDLGFTRVVDFGAITRWKGELVKGSEQEAPSPEG